MLGFSRQAWKSGRKRRRHEGDLQKLSARDGGGEQKTPLHGLVCKSTEEQATKPASSDLKQQADGL